MTALTMEVGRRVRQRPGARVRTAERHRTGRSHSTWLAPFSWALALACVIAFAGALPAAGDWLPRRSTAATIVVVGPADSLWSIAEAHPLPGASTNETVEAIMRVNGLDGALLPAGMKLRVPADSDRAPAYAEADAESADF